MRLYRASRRELFERLDQSQLRPLPAEPFVYGEWKLGARVSIDYHVELHGHYYSVPYALIHELVDACLTATTVELFHRGQRVAAHVRSVVRGRHTTEPAHMPKAHQHHLEWTPSRLITWARTIGAQTAALVEAILADRPHPEQGYRSCLGILRLAKRYGPDRLEAACARAGSVDARSYRHVDSILKHGLDRLTRPTVPLALLLPPHEHLRGRIRPGRGIARYDPPRETRSWRRPGPRPPCPCPYISSPRRTDHAQRPHARTTPRPQARRHGDGLDRTTAAGRPDGPRLRRALRTPRRGRVARPGEHAPGPRTPRGQAEALARVPRGDRLSRAARAR